VLATLLTIALFIVTSIVTKRRDRMEPVRPGPQIAFVSSSLDRIQPNLFLHRS